jgi:hypothetical protein
MLFSFKKVEKHTILVGQGGGASAPSCPPLQTPMLKLGIMTRQRALLGCKVYAGNFVNENFVKVTSWLQEIKLNYCLQMVTSHLSL